MSESYQNGGGFLQAIQTRNLMRRTLYKPVMYSTIRARIEVRSLIDRFILAPQ